MALHRLPFVTAALLPGLLLALGCSSVPPASPTPTASATPSPAPTPSPTLVTELSVASLRYLLLDQFAPISWCDPDFYPVAHADEQVLAEQRLPEIQADGPTYSAITTHLGLDSNAPPSPDETLAIYREWKLLNAVVVAPFEGAFSFDLITEANPGLGRGIHSFGRIDLNGQIEVIAQDETNLVACPICLARGTTIDTPSGPVAVENLRVGDPVWTLGSDGRRVAQPLVRIGSTPVPASHQVVHLVLDDGRAVFASPGHPTADGRQVGDLRAGDQLDGAAVLSAALAIYGGGSTFDILPASTSGLYWANGILLASTLR